MERYQQAEHLWSPPRREYNIPGLYGEQQTAFDVGILRLQ